MPAQDKRDINVSANPQASPKRARTASPEPSTAAPPSPPPPLLNPRDSASVTPHARTASPAIINNDDDSDSPPPLLNPRDSASVTPHARTASPAIINDDDDSDSPPPSPLLNPQASASVTPHARTASPAIINNDDDSDSPPPSPLFNPQASASVTPHARTASPAIINGDDDSDPPPPPLLNPQASASVAPRASTASPTIITDDDNPDGSENEKAAAWYTTMIFEALSTMNNSAGCSISEIANSIEKRNGVPENFRESLSSKLTDLVSMEKLEMDQNCFKIKKVSSSSQSESHNQTLEEAAAEAARLIAEAEHKEILAAEAVEELERVERMVEESEAILKMTEDLMRNAGAGEGNP